MTTEDRRAYARKRYHIRMQDPRYRLARARKSREYQRRYRATENGKAKSKAAYSRWASRNKEHIRKYQRENRRLWRYGLRRKECDELIKKQKGRCTICLKKPKRWTADHDHSSGRFRGLLCNLCNAGLGSFRDSTENLRRAIIYLEKQRTRFV